MNVILTVLLLVIVITAIRVACVRSKKVLRLTNRGDPDLSMLSTDYVYADAVQNEWFRVRQHGANYELRKGKG